MILSNVLPLPDGRTLGYAEYGDPAGRPVLFFHGTPGSRLTRHADEAIARVAGARVIAPDRPGYGLSSAQPGRTLLNWPADVAALANALGFDRFAVIGLSGGGPYALACAYALPDRVRAAGVVSGAGPLDRRGAMRGMMLVNRLGLAAARWGPGWVITRPSALGYRVIQRRPQLVLRTIAAAMPPADHAVLAKPEVLSISLESMTEAFRGGMGGLATDLAVLARPWGFPLAAIRVPVYLWYGDRDVNIPLHTGRYLARAIPTTRARFYRGQGHELIHAHWGAILQTVLAEDEPPVKA
ncbi:MAG TPA: alpha/beta hydrolase [Chloroflexia bacterium]|nr:alpha/beta hydrolase [Chloroflexia bacterium]